MDILPCVVHSVEGHTAGGVLPVVTSTDRAVHVAVPAPVHLFAAVWTDFPQEGGRPVIPVVDMDARAGRDQGATLCALAARARGPFHAPVLVRAQCLIPRIQDILGAEVARGQSAGEEEAIVVMISGIAGPGHRRLCSYTMLCF